MPIKPENRKLYPKTWKQISSWIRFQRAEGRCECRGECGMVHNVAHHGGRCTRIHGHRPADEISYTVVVLTVAHLDHDPENPHPMNLKAMCQRCHLALDKEQHQKNAAETRRKKKGQLALPL